MSRNPTYQSVPGGWSLGSIMRDMVAAWRLLWDPRVPGALKIILPLFAIGYWLSPIDLLPGLPFDDVALMILALRLFVQLAPADAVNGAFNGANRSGYSTSSRSEPDQTYADDAHNTVDTTWRVIND
ncbi:MAG: hypothetical protein HC802_10690 [Caldilineaceae bacterium]|nr:hypothetical protein [Caldilineaceae bacterium]